MKRNAAAPAMLTNNYDEVHFVHIQSLTPVSTHHLLGLMGDLIIYVADFNVRHLAIMFTPPRLRGKTCFSIHGLIASGQCLCKEGVRPHSWVHFIRREKVADEIQNISSLGNILTKHTLTVRLILLIHFEGCGAN